MQLGSQDTTEMSRFAPASRGPHAGGSEPDTMDGRLVCVLMTAARMSAHHSAHLDTQPAATVVAVHAASLLVHALPTEGTLARVACWARPGYGSARLTVAPRAVNKNKGRVAMRGLSHCPGPGRGPKKLKVLALPSSEAWFGADCSGFGHGASLCLYVEFSDGTLNNTANAASPAVNQGRTAHKTIWACWLSGIDSFRETLALAVMGRPGWN